MPGFRKIIVVAAFNQDASGELVDAFEPRYMTTEDSAIYAAQTLINDHDGVVAWSREANPAVGEEGPTIILFQYGKIPNSNEGWTMTEFSRDVEAALGRYAADNAIDRDQALQQLVAIGLRAQGQLAPEQSIDTDTSETVQYPEFVSDASGGAGG